MSITGFALLQETTMNSILRTALAVAGLSIATQAAAQITFYEHDRFAGRYFTTDKSVGNFGRYGFNDRASSAVVLGDRWEVCEDARFNGRCVVLRPGSYPSLAAMGLNDRISSVREVRRETRRGDDHYATDDYRRRNSERLYEADVTSVHAVLGPPEQRCWVEREQVAQERGNANVPGAIAGAVIGGILGHQIGNGRGNDLATVGGAVAGAAVGSNVGRSGEQQVSTRDVKRCENVPGHAKPDHWDVTYTFHGQAHRVQLATPPGRTITVNERGEPRD